MPGDLDRPGARPLHFLRRHGFPGRIHPVNPRHREIGGLTAAPSLEAVPGPVDVAWIGLPAGQAPEAVRACGRAGIPFAIVLGAGFAEVGPGGETIQADLGAAAREAGVRLVGPNTVGFINAWDRVALTFSTVAELPALDPGPVALLSQSGGTGGCLLNRAVDRGLGVGLFVSTGNEADLGLADYLEWLAEDGRARAVACVVEQVRAPARFAAAVDRAVSRGIPVVALKLGGSPTGARTARSHTASLVGRRDAWRAWARAIGLLEVEAAGALVETAAYLAGTPPVAGNRVAMITSSGGIAVLLADALEPRGFAFPPLAAETVRRVRALVPAFAAVGNPVDVTAGLPEPVFGEVLRAVVEDPGVDLVVVPLTMATTTGGRARAAEVLRAAGAATKPLSVCWPAGSLVEAGRRTLAEARLPLFESVESCATALGASLALRAFRARSGPPRPAPAAPADAGRPPALPDGEGPLAWPAARALLEASGLPVAPEAIVHTETEARQAVGRLGLPVAVKRLGRLHKTEAGGVRLGLGDAEAVARAVRDLAPGPEGCLVQPMAPGLEVLVGALRDPVLGPFVVVAPGGIHAELYGERAMRPAPVAAEEAGAMVAECRALSALLAGHRQAPAGSREALVDTVVRASRLAAALGPRLRELDLNPVMVGPAGARIVDVRVVLGPA